MKKILGLILALEIVFSNINNVNILNIRAEETENTLGTMVYAGMTEDFNKISEQPEHRRWTQGCNSGGKYGECGVCGCKTEKDISQWTSGCWNSIQMGSNGYNGQTIGSAGCVVTSICMLVAESGVTKDSNFNPAEFFMWGKSHNMWNGSNVNGYKWISDFNPNLQWIERVCLTNSSSTAETDQATLVKAVREQLEKGYMMIGRVNSDAHTVFVLGTGINPNTGLEDVIICDPAPNPLPMEGDNMYLHGEKNRCKGHGIIRFEVYKVTGNTFYANNSNVSSSNDISGGTSSTSVGSLLYTDDEEITVPSMNINLVDLGNEDKSKLSKIREELDLIESRNRYVNTLSIVGTVIGIFLILSVVLMDILYMLDIVIGTDLINKFTLGRYVSMQEETETYQQERIKVITRRRIIKGTVIGLIVASVFMNTSLIYKIILLIYNKI